MAVKTRQSRQSSGDRKILKAKNNQKRIDRFNKRKEEGKNYNYSKEKSESKIIDGLKKLCVEGGINSKDYKDNVNYYHHLFFSPNKNSKRITEYQTTKSFIKKLEYQLEQEAKKKKKEKRNINV